MLDGGEANRSALFAKDAVPLALLFMAAYQRADGGEGIVLKERAACLIVFSLEVLLDDLRDGRVNGEAALALGIAAVQAPLGLKGDFVGHGTTAFLISIRVECPKGEIHHS